MCWVQIPARQCVPLWPVYGGRSYICRVEGSPETTVPFSVLDTNPSLLMLANKYGGIDVRVKTDNSQVGGYTSIPSSDPKMVVKMAI